MEEVLHRKKKHFALFEREGKIGMLYLKEAQNVCSLYHLKLEKDTLFDEDS